MNSETTSPHRMRIELARECLVRKRHSWSDKFAYERHSDRCCWSCALIKRTRHEDGRHWVEYLRDDVVISRDRTPECPGEKPLPAEYVAEAA